MSFHSSVTADAVMPATLRSLLGASAGNVRVHVGRRPKWVPAPGTTEAAVIRGRVRTVSTGGFNKLRAHDYTIVVRQHQGGGGHDRTGKTEQTAVEAVQRAIVDAYDGLRLHHASVTGLQGWKATEGAVDRDPENEAVLMAEVELTALVDAGA